MAEPSIFGALWRDLFQNGLHLSAFKSWPSQLLDLGFTMVVGIRFEEGANQ
jgi:hypothetical protein